MEGGGQLCGKAVLEVTSPLLLAPVHFSFVGFASTSVFVSRRVRKQKSQWEKKHSTGSDFKTVISHKSAVSPSLALLLLLVPFSYSLGAVLLQLPSTADGQQYAKRVWRWCPPHVPRQGKRGGGRARQATTRCHFHCVCQWVCRPQAS